MQDAFTLRQNLATYSAPEIGEMARMVKDALESDSRDAEQFALIEIAGMLGIEVDNV